MLINHEKAKVNKLETVDGVLKNVGESYTHIITTYSYYHCSDEELVDMMIESFEEQLSILKNTKLQNTKLQNTKEKSKKLVKE